LLDDFEMSDDWRKDVAALEERLTRLEEQFKEILAFETRRERSDEKVGEWKPRPDAEANDFRRDESLYYEQRDFHSNSPNGVNFREPRRLPFATSQNTYSGSSRDIPVQYLPRDVIDGYRSRDFKNDFESQEYHNDWKARDNNNYDDELLDVPYIARPSEIL